MNSTNIKSVLVLFMAIILSACEKSEIKDLTPQNTIDCEPIGLGDAHPKGMEYKKILNKYVGKGFPGISAAIYSPDHGLWVGTSGLADVRNKTAMNTCHLLHSGSVAKMYTATAAMVLYEQGLLNLDGKISNYLSAKITNSLPNAKIATIRQLLNHSAGIPDHDYDVALNDYLERNDAKLPSPEEQLAYLFDDEAKFAPGAKTEYSSANTLTLALVLDSIANGNHYDVVSQNIINKIGLEQTFYKNETGYPYPLNLVRGYYGKANKNEDLTKESVNYSNGSYGDAGIIASAHDYYLFLRNLVELNIIGQDSLDEMLTGEFSYDDGTYSLDFGLGLFLIGLNGETVKIGHSGGTIGGMSHLYYYPKEGLYIALLTNTFSEEDATFLQQWNGNVVVGAGGESIMEELEALHIE